MKTVNEVRAWCAGAKKQFGDPAIPVSQLFVRYVRGPATGNDLLCFREPGRYVLRLGANRRLLFPVAISLEGPKAPPFFAAEYVCRGVWALSPSLNVPGVIHGFVVLYEVPHPAPWDERRSSRMQTES
jgi:hypothetical protein